MSPTPRDNVDGYKPTRTAGFVLPCGVARKPGQVTTPLQAGAMQMVAWEETITHPGCFLIEFGPTDSATETFQLLTTYKHPNTTKAPMNYQTMVKLPDQECTNCVLRIRQVMMDNNTATCPPANMPDMAPILYYSCANITLQKSGGGAEPDASAPTPDASASEDTGSGTGGQIGTGGAGGTGVAPTPDAATSGTAGTGGTTTGGTGGQGTGTGGANGGAGPEVTGGSTGAAHRPGGGGCAVNDTKDITAPAIVLVTGAIVSLRRRRRRR